tara:strand:- start:47 stop:580 length:534 start_codon:yes stop_codon:yes gene_type:complete
MPISINGSAGTVTGIVAGGLPDGIIQSADLASGAGGKINQVVTQIYEPGGSDISTTSTSFVDTGMTLSITPSNTNSKIFIFGIANGHRVSSSVANSIINIKRAVSGGSTNVLSGQSLGLAHTYSNLVVTTPIFFVDGTTGTAQRTYTVQHKTDSGSVTSHIFRANTSNMFMLAEILP